MKRSRTLMFAALAALALLGCSDTASAQPQLTVSPVTTPSSPMVFNNIPAGEVSQSQPVTVSTANQTTATVIIQVSPSSPWLQVTPNGSVNIPATFSVAANTTTLPAGPYNGSFTVSVDGAPEDTMTVYVSLTVIGVTSLSANPSTLAFAAQAGATGGSPSSTQVVITSAVGPLAYNLQVNYNPAVANWLLLSATQGSTSGPAFTVSVNPSVLSPTVFPVTYNATIVAQSTTTSDSVAIVVQLTINSTTTLSVTPTSPPPFLYQVGTASDPAPQQLSVSASEGSTTFTVQENPPQDWLVVSPLNDTASTTPAIVTLNVTPHEQGLTPGVYSTDLIITPNGEASLAPVPITLVVAAHPLLQLSTNTLFFQVPFAGGPSLTESLIVSSSGSAQVPFTVTSSESWQTASASANTTPATLTVQVNPSSLNIQSYTGTLTLTPTNGDEYTETVTVNLTVTSPDQLVAGPDALLFSYEPGQSPPPQQTVQITSTGQYLNFNVSTATANCGSNWLTATPVEASTTSSITVGVVTTGLAAGDCSGTVTLSYQSGLGPATLVIPVTLAVSNSAELSIAMGPNFGVAVTPLGSGQFDQQIALTSTDPSDQVSFNASIMNVSGGAWLGIAGSTSGATPQNLTIQISPGVLSIPGTYSGTLVISSNSLGTAELTVQVSLTVTSSTTVTVSPLTLPFTEPQGGAPSAPQTVTLSSSPNTATYTAVINYINGTGWLQISPTSGNTNGTITVTVLPNTLSQGQYNAQISLAFQDASTTATNVNVVLNVTAAQTVSVSPPSLNFSYQMGAAAPASLPLSITSTGGSATVAVTATSTGWLSVNSSGGVTPQTISVSVNPSGLSAQTYTGSISVSAPGVLSAPISVPVTFTVSAAPGPIPIRIINNATGVSGVIAPGEEIAIQGNFLGPATPAGGVTFSVDSQGGVSSTLSGVQVLFDNNPGTPIYVSADQINVIVPYEINGRLSTSMVVTYDGGTSQSFPLAVASVAPGLFTNNFTGSGQVAALNQNGTVNGSASGYQAATPGSVISLYGTGGGQTDPPSTTGSITPIPTSASQLLTIPSVTATVGGVPATVNFAGAAPGLATGVFQVNVVIPLGVSPGNAVPVTISMDGVATPIGTTIAVQ